MTRRWDGISGELYESAVVAEFIKILEAFRLTWRPYHLRTYDRREIDLLLVRDDRVIPIEIKSAERVSNRDARHLRHVEEVTGLRSELGLVVYRGREIVQLEQRIWAIPDAILFGARPLQR